MLEAIGRFLTRILWFSRTNATTGFLVCNLRPDFKFDVRRSLEPFKDLDGHFDPLTALTKRFQTLSNGACVSRILSAGVETDYGREKAYCCVTQRYYRILNCVVNPLS